MLEEAIAEQIAFYGSYGLLFRVEGVRPRQLLLICAHVCLCKVVRPAERDAIMALDIHAASPNSFAAGSSRRAPFERSAAS